MGEIIIGKDGFVRDERGAVVGEYPGATLVYSPRAGGFVPYDSNNCEKKWPVRIENLKIRSVWIAGSRKKIGE